MKKPRIGGTGESNVLKSGPETFQVSINNVNAALDESKIKDYVSGKGLTAQNIEDTSSAEWNTKRFLLTFGYDDYEAVMCPEFWPKKIYFRRWFPARAKRQQTTLTS